MSSVRVSSPRALGGVAAAVIAATLIAACSSGSGSVSGGGAGAATAAGGGSTSTAAGGTTASNGKITVGDVLAAPVSALEAIGSGVQKEAAALGMNYVEESANFSADQQISAMQALEAKHVNVIVSAP